MAVPYPSEDRTEALLAAHGRQHAGAAGELLATHRAYLRHVVALRFPPEVASRLDPSDVVQEALFEAARRLDDYLARRPMPFRLWLRAVAVQRLTDLHRRHAGAACRSLARELPLPDSSSALVLGASDGAGPESRLARQETEARVREALARLDEDDREVILMRLYEEMTNEEVALVLGVQPAASSKRYARALLRLRPVLRELGVHEAEP